MHLGGGGFHNPASISSLLYDSFAETSHNYNAEGRVTTNTSTAIYYSRRGGSVSERLTNC